MNKMFHNKIIKVDGKETYLLAHWLSDLGIVLEISGPETIVLHEHTVTELNGDALVLDDKETNFLTLDFF